MVDITAKLFWYRSKEWYGIMADKLTDIVYTDESKETIDVINLLLLGWVLLGLIVYIIGNIIATYLRKRKSSLPSPETSLEEPQSSGHVSCAKTNDENVFSEPKETEILPTVPVCDEGDDPEVVEWINNVFSWIYKQRIVSPIIDSWLSALNARTRLSSTEHGILVDFKDIHSSSPPKITDVRQSVSSNYAPNINCQMELENTAFDIVVTQFKEKEKVIVPFTLNLQRLFGKVSVECIPEELHFLSKYSETPQIQLSAEVSSSHEGPSEDSEPLCDLVCEITSEALSTTSVPLRLSCFPACPRLSLENRSEDDVFEAAESETDQHLLVKIIKATNLGGSKGCLKPYCVVEMDEPPQRFETQVVEGTNNPFWDEAYTFSVKDSAELLFEIYDNGKPSPDSFLGLGIVGLDELVKNPSQRQIIPLQSRPLEDDDITGCLTAEFLFLNQTTPVSESTYLAPHIVAKGNDVPGSGKTVETNSRVTSGGTVITTTTIKRTNEEVFIALEPNTIANSNSLPPAGPNLTPLHEAEDRETVLHKPTTPPPAMNGDCKILRDEDSVTNPTLLPPPHSFLNKNFEEEEVANEQHLEAASGDLGTKTVEESPLACVHVHVELPTFVVEEPLSNGSLMSQMDESHVPTFENSAHEDPDTLPPILESVVMGPLLSNGLEKDEEADLPGTALKELEKHNTPTATSKSTLIIHSVQRPDNPATDRSLEASPASHLSKDSRTSESMPSSPSQERANGDRSRPKEKKSFMGSLRRRLSFNKNRSKSTENRFENASNYSQTSSRSASTDRVRQLSTPKMSPFKDRFLGRKFLTVPFSGSTRSSLSEASGISASSGRTYTNENSTLVIETNENGIMKRYLIPNSLVHRSKWKKRGTKLHIFNDHVFLAKHLSGMTICEVCHKRLTRRPGKQGYECRGCNLQCHKSCHVKVETYCSNSSITSMEVEYVHDPKGASPKSV